MISERHSAAARENLRQARALRNHPAGENNPRWGGGSYVAVDGYRYLRISCENGRTRYRLEHRVIMERLLGRRLHRREHVHHKNGVKTDNRIENLEVLMDSQHALLHQYHAPSRLTVAQQDQIRQLHAGGLSSARIGRLFGISQTHALRIAKGFLSGSSRRPNPLGLG